MSWLQERVSRGPKSKAPASVSMRAPLISLSLTPPGGGATLLSAAIIPPVRRLLRDFDFPLHRRMQAADVVVSAHVVEPQRRAFAFQHDRGAHRRCAEHRDLVRR